MKLFLLTTISLMISVPAFAALPPLWQNVAELKLILNDQQLTDHLQSGESIMDIKKNGQGWTIFTNHHRLDIEVIVQKQTVLGPAHFSLKFGQAAPLHENQ